MSTVYVNPINTAVTSVGEQLDVMHKLSQMKNSNELSNALEIVNKWKNEATKTLTGNVEPTLDVKAINKYKESLFVSKAPDVAIEKNNVASSSMVPK